MKRYGRKARLFAAAGLAMFIAACDEDRRGVDAPPPAPLAELEGVSQLPYAEPAQVQYYEPERAYPYAERAYGLQRAFYDAPPDYGFPYDDVSPYVWESADDWALYAEPWEGDYRYYYYEPDAPYPYFVRDRDYGYAFSAAGLLIAMFYPDGRYVPVDVAYRTAPLAGRYYARGRDLRRVSREARRFEVSDSVWVTEAPRVVRSADPWLRAARDDRGWRAWRERDGDRELRRFDAETRRRQAVAETWREKADRRREATIEQQEDRLEAQALRTRRETEKDRRREAAPQARPRAEAGRRQMEQRQAQAERKQRAEAQRRAETASIRKPQQEAQRRQVEAQQRQKAQEHALRAEQGQGRQAEAQQRRRAQDEAARSEQAQRRQAEAQQRQQAQAQRRRPEQSRPEQQARAPSADERGRPAAAREDAGKERGRGDNERRKD